MTRLQALRKEINEYEKAKRLRESRIEVIETLKEFQTGPVRLLNHVHSQHPARLQRLADLARPDAASVSRSPATPTTASRSRTS